MLSGLLLEPRMALVPDRFSMNVCLIYLMCLLNALKYLLHLMKIKNKNKNRVFAFQGTLHFQFIYCDERTWYSLLI